MDFHLGKIEENILLWGIFVHEFQFAGSTSVQPVQVSVYYESLCPDSMYFISDQLWPTFQKIAQIFTVDLVPFGKANVIMI